VEAVTAIPPSQEVELEDLRCISVAAVARLLGKSTSHIYGLIHGGDPTFPFVRVGNSYSVPVRRFRDWFEATGTPLGTNAPGQNGRRRPSLASPRTGASARHRERTLDDVMPWRRGLR
jgi:predicted DNA-binding transcriptional regulator AlpA